MIAAGEPLGEYNEYKNAIRFSSAQERDKYISINKEIQMIFQTQQKLKDEQERLDNEKQKEKQRKDDEKAKIVESEWQMVLEKCEPYKLKLIPIRKAFIALMLFSFINIIVLLSNCDFSGYFSYELGYDWYVSLFIIFLIPCFLGFVIAIILGKKYSKSEKEIYKISVNALTSYEKSFKWYGIVFTASPLVLHIIFSIIDAS